MRLRLLISFCALLVGSSASGISHVMPAKAVAATSVVTVSGVAADNSSAKIYFNPVAGARDYRVYDAASPKTVKYAGLTHLIASDGCPSRYCHFHFVLQADGHTPAYPYQVVAGSMGGPPDLDVPALSIEWNMLSDNQSHTLIVQAVDQLGPVSHDSLYNIANNASLNARPSSSMVMPGMDEGPTNDGLYSINGQGPYTNVPHVIAQSAPFVVRANMGHVAIPSSPQSSQRFFDTFADSEGATLKRTAIDVRHDNALYTLNGGTPLAESIQLAEADVTDSMPFVADGHFMDVLFDGGTPTSHNPLHTRFASLSLSPSQTADMTHGGILHLTMEVDGHFDARRWVAFQISPANSAVTTAETGSAISSTDRAVFVELRQGSCQLRIFTGPKSATDLAPAGTAGGPHGSTLWGGSGGAPYNCGKNRYVNYSNDGIAFDNRSRFDFFISQGHAALFENQTLLAQSDIPAGSFPWFAQPLRVYYTHVFYHDDNDVRELRSGFSAGCNPMNSFWFNDPANGTPASADACGAAFPAGYGFPRSDERHWDNLGYEVLPQSQVPGSTDFSSMASLIAMPSVVAPVYTTAGSVSANNTSPTATSIAPASTTTLPTTTLPTTTPRATSPPRVTVTPQPTKTPQMTSTPRPTSTSRATATPRSTSTSRATATPRPTSAPQPNR